MAVELSSNWKKLQAQIKSEPSSKPLAKKPTAVQPAAKPPKKSVGKQASTGKRPREATGASQSKSQPPSKRPRPRPAAASRAAMGVTQSSQPTKEKAVTPSLALWAEENDISPESLAQAYGLGGIRGRGSGAGAGAGDAEAARAAMAAAAKNDRENGGLTAGLNVGRYVALDCEMVGVGEGGHDDALARVSLVDFFGRQVYDSYVQMQPHQRVVDWRTRVSGITARHLRQARSFEEVRETVAALLRGDPDPSPSAATAAVDTPALRKIQQAGGRILVGHDVRHDLQALELAHPPRLIRDTAKFSGFKQYGHGPKPALRVLALTLLGVSIQQGAHSSVEDARVTMQLFRLHKPAFDVECANRFGDEGDDVHVQAAGGGSSSSRRKPKRGKRRH